MELELCVDSQLVTNGATLWLLGWIRRKWRTKQGSPVANRDQWTELQSLLQERRAPTKWVKVPSHTGLYGNDMADELADQGVRQHGVRLEGQERPSLKRPAD